jgi:hypothetical protein
MNALNTNMVRAILPELKVKKTLFIFSGPCVSLESPTKANFFTLCSRGKNPIWPRSLSSKANLVSPFVLVVMSKVTCPL